MRYTCWGAAKQVTGSMHHIQTDSGFNILIDCGLDYEDRTNTEVNSKFPFRPADIDVLILTHAHIDHSGNIPNLVRQGFKGEVICTEPTSYLLDKLWTDSVNIMNSDSRRNKGRAKLYGYKDVKDANERLLTLPFYRRFALSPNVHLTFYEAGHILGAASILLEVEENGKTKRIGFTGDLGPDNSKLIVDPKPMDDLDYLVMETTYGDRLHYEKRSAEEVLTEHVKKTCVDQNGRLIIPAFSVGRTQAVLFTLKKLFETKKLPPIRVYADSPLALASTNIHHRFTDYLNEEARASAEQYNNLFDFMTLHLVEDEDDVEEMDHFNDACIIVSSAGMLDGGRIQQHVSDHIQNTKCTILIAGFCAPGSLGAQLLSGANSLRIRGRDRYVYANITQTDVFSAHPDADGLKAYLNASDHEGLKRIFFVHGEDASMQNLAGSLMRSQSKRITIPERGEQFDL